MSLAFVKLFKDKCIGRIDTIFSIIRKVWRIITKNIAM